MITKGPILAMVAGNLIELTAFAMDPASFHPIIGQIVLLITTLAGFWYNIYRDNKKREWDIEDRKLARESNSRQLQENKSISQEISTKLDESKAMAESKTSELEKKLTEVQNLFQHQVDAKLREVEQVTKATLKIVKNGGEAAKHGGTGHG